MLPADITVDLNDHDLGRAAAEAILKRGTDAAVFQERLTPAFARSALYALSDYFVSQGFMRQMMEGAARGASQLNVEEFNGLIEVKGRFGIGLKTLARLGSNLGGGL